LQVFDVLNTTGLSDSLLRVVQRRQSMDAMLVYGGIAFTLCFVWLLWWWNASRGHHH
jgi:Golgi SNAP receptor complex protein 2